MFITKKPPSFVSSVSSAEQFVLVCVQYFVQIVKLTESVFPVFCKLFLGMLKRTGMFSILTSGKFVLLVPTFVCALRSYFFKFREWRWTPPSSTEGSVYREVSNTSLLHVRKRVRGRLLPLQIRNFAFVYCIGFIGLGESSRHELVLI